MKKKKRKYDEVNYWETMADSLIALLLCILLIALLLILYLVRMPEEHIDDELGNSSEQYTESLENNGLTNIKDDNDDANAWANGGYGEYGTGGSTGGGGEDSGDGGNGNETDKYPNPGMYEGEGYGKAAVYVEIVDGETNRTIKYENVEFELYDLRDQLQVLSTYYPEKIDYKKFLTDEAGTFYFPEKIIVQDYYLHALTRVPGYDYPEDTYMEIDEGYEWNEPYTVKVLMYPEKNIIRVRLMDQNTGKTITGSTFDVVAATDITTKDGTIRAKEGDIVDTITLDANGYGESIELYLGDYILQQAQVPQYYAKLLEDTAVTVDSKAKSTEVKVTELREEKTKARLTLADELYPTNALEGIGFTLTSADGKSVLNGTTNEKGVLTFKDLLKDTTYTLHQNDIAEGYRNTAYDYEFTVDVNGLITGAALHEIPLSNRKVRISVGVQDKLFRGQVSDVNVSVCDASGELIKSWSTTAIEQILEGLEPGEYMIILAGDKSNAKIVTVEDVAEIQNFNFSKWTTTDIGALLGLFLFLLAFLIFLIFWLIHKAKEKEEEKEAEKEMKQNEEDNRMI